MDQQWLLNEKCIQLIEETWNETPRNLTCPAYCFHLRLVLLVAVAIQQRLKAPTEDEKGEGNSITKQAGKT